MLASCDQKACCKCCICSTPCIEAGSQVLKIVSGIHGVQAGAQPFLDLAHHALLHRPEIGQAEEGTGLLGVQLISTFTFMAGTPFVTA